MQPCATPLNPRKVKMYYTNLEDDLRIADQKNEKLVIQNARLRARLETLKSFLTPEALEFANRLPDPLRDE